MGFKGPSNPSLSRNWLWASPCVPQILVLLLLLIALFACGCCQSCGQRDLPPARRAATPALCHRKQGEVWGAQEEEQRRGFRAETDDRNMKREVGTTKVLGEQKLEPKAETNCSAGPHSPLETPEKWEGETLH